MQADALRLFLCWRFEMTLSTLKDLNALSSEGCILYALDIAIPDTEMIYIVKNRENISYGGNTYLAFEFSIGDITSGKGETPTLQLSIDNTSLVMGRYAEAYDILLKQNGIDGNIIKATLHILNTHDLSQSISDYYFELTDFKITGQWATFNLGAKSLWNKTYPLRKIYANFCGFKFKDERCGYVGSLTSCNKTLSDCRARGNSVRFGAYPGTGESERI